MALRHALLRWFRRNRRELPWRGTRDPYRIWLSEVMLQQTRVAAVTPYYTRFVRRFPTIKRLARARREEVLRLWAGLGYYSRARNLHRAAKEIVRRHSGRFPRDYEAALALPGVGRYTAAAVLSIAFGEPFAVLDGNVARALARLEAIRGDLRALRQWKQLQAAAQQLLDPVAPGDWNQAMMELGATVCTPRAPRCPACPLAQWCKARRRGFVHEVPAKRKKRAPVKVQVAAAILLDPEGRTLLVRRDGGLFSRMWQFPAIEAKRDAAKEIQRYIRVELGRGNSTQRARRTQRSTERQIVPLASAKHAVTFREITLLPFLVRVMRLPKLNGARVVRLDRLDHLPISSATRKIAQVVADAAGLIKGRA